ncbi:hypothetical protein L9F63_005842, partial [Diploptera punctata]
FVQLLSNHDQLNKLLNQCHSTAPFPTARTLQSGITLCVLVSYSFVHYVIKFIAHRSFNCALHVRKLSTSVKTVYENHNISTGQQLVFNGHHPYSCFKPVNIVFHCASDLTLRFWIQCVSDITTKHFDLGKLENTCWMFYTNHPGQVFQTFELYNARVVTELQHHFIPSMPQQPVVLLHLCNKWIVCYVMSSISLTIWCL